MNNNFIKRINNLWRGVINNTEWNTCKRLWNFIMKKVFKRLIKIIRKIFSSEWSNSYEPIYNLESYIYDKTENVRISENRKILK